MGYNRLEMISAKELKAGDLIAVFEDNLSLLTAKKITDIKAIPAMFKEQGPYIEIGIGLDGHMYEGSDLFFIVRQGEDE